MDPFSVLLSNFSLHAGVFYTGNICGIHDFERDPYRGHLHLLRHGDMQVLGLNQQDLHIDQPTLLFLPRPENHRLLANDQHGADVVCATIEFGGGSAAGQNPITASLPDVVLVPLAELPGMDAILELMFDEAFAAGPAGQGEPGKQPVLDRLCEVLIIRLLRHCMEHGLTRGGTLAGLSDPRLAKALAAMHEVPGHPWDLVSLADKAGMSRARFAVHFRAVTGDTPLNYLASWRILNAQRLLRKGMPLKVVALDVGYGSTSALNRAFVRATGVAPMQWLKLVQVDAAIASS
jgi:AraC-like DNA-binding protein